MDLQFFSNKKKFGFNKEKVKIKRKESLFDEIVEGLFT